MPTNPGILAAPAGTNAPIDFSAINVQPQGEPFVPSPAAPTQQAQIPSAIPASQLDETSRSKLDGIVQQMQTNKESDANIQAVVDDFKQKYSAPSGPTPPGFLDAAKSAAGFAAKTFLPAPSFVASLLPKAPGQVADAFNSGVSQAKQGFDTTANAQNPDDLVTGAIKMGTGVVNAVYSPLAPVTAPVGDAVRAVSDKISNIPAVQKFATSPAGEATSKVADFVGDTSTLFGAVAGMKTPVAKDAVGAVTDSISPKPTSQAVQDLYTRAVKPTISGKATLAASDKYKANVQNAVQTIIENKPSLKFTTEDGAIEKGRTPQSLSEFTQALDQTKKSIYSQYDTVAKAAGEKGVTVSPQSFVQDLGKVIANKALQLSHPEAIAYAQSMLKRFNKEEPIDAHTAQSVIENYNAEMQAFYRNPTYNQASKVAIDAALVKNLRESLDKAVSESSGTQYQALRDKYGALKAIEGDVNKAANRVARLNNKGLADYTDIFSGGDIAAGILTLNPALFTKGVAQGAIKSWFKSINSPDAAIKNLFEKAGQPQSISKATLPTKTPTATATAMPIK